MRPFASHLVNGYGVIAELAIFECACAPMQPVLTIVAGVVAVATTVWLVDRVLRSVFPTASRSLLGAGLISAAIWLFFFRLFPVALFLLVLGAAALAPGNPQSQGGRRRRYPGFARRTWK